jgi:dipeptidyl aminopeptidase/acylaminoacyl peptidase
MHTRNPQALTPLQKGLLIALASLYFVLIVLWWFNNKNKPIFEIGAVEGFGRVNPPVAATASMTWRITPQLGSMAVHHVVSPPPAASSIEKLGQIEAGANGATVWRVQYLSDSTVVYGILGVPSGAKPSPAVVVCHPSDTPYTTGLHTLDTVKRLAEMGVIAFAPDYRGWGPSGGARGNEVRDVWNALASLRKMEGVRLDRIGVIGFSMGGGIAARAAVGDTGLALLVLYYPQMFGSVDELVSIERYGQAEPGQGALQQFLNEATQAGADLREKIYALRMISPIYHLRDFGGRVAVFHGVKDNVVSIRQSEGLEKELRRIGKQVQFERYPELSHAFANSIENPSKAKFEAVIRESLLN